MPRQKTLPDPDQDIADGLLIPSGERDAEGREVYRWSGGDPVPPWDEIPMGWDYATRALAGRVTVVGLVKLSEPQPATRSAGRRLKRVKLRRRAAAHGRHLRLVWVNPRPVDRSG